ncbi:hypothetical protein [Deinococcus sp.]|uniref:hypothetical protein n=1 Tax=Deinococcus sp. TaxID=47478 RepID=UPI003C7A6485
MDDEYSGEVEARGEPATPGPWRADDQKGNPQWNEVFVMTGRGKTSLANKKREKPKIMIYRSLSPRHSSFNF